MMLCLLTPFLAWGLLSLLPDPVRPFPFVLFLPAIFVGAWLGDRPGGVLSTLISVGLMCLLAPKGSFAGTTPAHAFSLGIFAAMGLLTAQLHHRLRSTRNALSRANAALRQAESGARRIAGLHATLNQCNQAMMRRTTVTDLLQQICEDAVNIGGMKMAWVGLLDERDRRVRPVAFAGEGSSYLDDIHISTDGKVPAGCGPTGTAMREDRPFWCQDYQHDPATAPWHDRGRQFGWASSAALPLHRDGSVSGALTLYSREPQAFDAEARELLIRMATDIDLALDRCHKEAEHARMAATLLESEEKYRNLAEGINDVIWVLDPETQHLLYVSPSVFKLRGYTSEEIMAMPIEKALAPRSLQRIRELLSARQADAGAATGGGYLIDEAQESRKDGSIVWVEIAINLVLNPKSGRKEVHGASRDISERKKAEAHIQHLAHFDQLTGLPNRTSLGDRFDYALTLAQRHGEPLAVMFLDLDHFKNINDSLGHHVGDQLLVEVASRLSSLLRAGDTVARMGGDEFILILPDADADGAVQVATKLIESISRPYFLGRHELHTTPSIGIAMYPEDGADMDTLYRNADAAMYQVKRESRNGFRFFTQEMQARSRRALSLANALHEALENGEFTLLYQPLLSLQDGRVVGAEALLRWKHPGLGPISPNEFIPIAETSGLINRIGAWVLRQALSQARHWQETGFPGLIMSVNLSVVQFRDPDLPTLVTHIIREAGVPHECLQLELTEAVAMDDPQAAVRIMNELCGLGIHMAIDDFGTGHSSLSHLKRFRADKLKIARSFVRDIPMGQDDRTIVAAIIGLAHSLGMRTIAEGVETRGQIDFLKQQGCDEVQGHYFSAPLTAGEFEDYLHTPGDPAAGPGRNLIRFPPSPPPDNDFH